MEHLRRRRDALARLSGCPTTDSRFLSVVAEALTLGLDCRWAGIGYRSEDGETINVVAMHDRKSPTKPFDYPTAGSPCETVYTVEADDTYNVIERDLTAKHSVPKFLAANGAQSYRGESIRDADGVAFAHAFVVDDKPIQEDESDQLFFKLASQKVGALLCQRRAEEALRGGEDRYHTIVDNIADGFFIHDMDGRVLDTNQRACSVLGYAREEIQAMRIWDIEVGLSPEEIKDIWRNAVPGRTVMLEGMHRRKDGSVFPVDVRGRVFEEAGRWQVLVNARDMTETRKAQTALVEARVEAENANRAKSNFIANVSHELRTPLNAIIGFSQILNQELLGPMGNHRYTEYADDIHASGQHLLTVISDILDLSKMEAGKETLQESLIDLDTLIEEAMNLASGEAFARSITLDAPDSAADTRFSGDPVKLRRVLINLLSNAVKYTPRGGTVRVAVEVDPPSGILVRVADDGPGMTSDEVERAFDAFQRLDPKVRDGETGTGLGLPIARKLCELHGGTLELDSAPGHGTRALVLLPPERIVSIDG